MKRLYPLFMAFLFVLSTTETRASNILKRAERLPEIQIDGVSGFSVRELSLVAGNFYRLKMTSDGKDEYLVTSSNGFFQSIFVNEVVVNDLEIKTTSIWGLEYDDDGSIEVFFVPMRVGKYSIGIQGLTPDGFITHISVQ
jgi:hypothetical protein